MAIMEFHKPATPQLNVFENIAERSTISLRFRGTVGLLSPKGVEAMLLWCCWKRKWKPYPRKLMHSLSFSTTRVGAEHSQEDVFRWNAMIREYVVHKRNEAAVQLYSQMVGSGLEADNFTFPSVIKACGSLESLQLGKVIHSHLLQKGFQSDAFVVSALIDMYAKCKEIEIARQLFDKTSQRDVVSWNAMIAGYAKKGDCETLELYRLMLRSGEKQNPNSITFATVLSAYPSLFTGLQHGREIHNHIMKTGFASDILVGNALVAMYAKCGNIDDACLVFDKMRERDTVTWNTIIAGCVQNWCWDRAFDFFHQMKVKAVEKPNAVTVSSILPACAALSALQRGKEIHAYIVRNEIGYDAFVISALIDVYAKCGKIEMAGLLFDRMNEIDVVLWSAMIAAYVQNGLSYKALDLFRNLQIIGLKPNSVTIASILPACAKLASPKPGKEIHVYITKNRLEGNSFVGSALIDMYAKSGSVDTALTVFKGMSQRDVASWNSMMTGHVHNDKCDEVIKLFRQMVLDAVKPDEVTFAILLSACAHRAALRHGTEIHNYIIRNGFEFVVMVGSALVDMYTKCGGLKVAWQVFVSMSQRNVVSWNTMIAGYGMHGYGKDAIILFNQMQEAGVKPDYITFIAIMSACSHAGLLDEGFQYFHSMSRDYRIMPGVEHYACMVDLLGRSGKLDKAYSFIKNMPLEPDAGIWGGLLGACVIHGNIELGELVAEHLFELEPENAGYYVLLSNIYRVSGRWDRAAKVRAMMKARGLKKTPGCSWIEVRNRVHTFFAGDKSHPQSMQIYLVLENLTGQIKQAGYVPITSPMLHYYEDE